MTALVAPLLLLTFVEGALRLVGYGYPSGFTIPCTVQNRAASCDNDRFTWQFFPPGAFRLPHSFAIPAQKPPQTFRIFIVGESAAQGVPEPSYAFGRYLQAMLRERYSTLRFEVINTSISSINSHVLLPMTRDLTRHHGDLFILYIGNNEVVGPYGPGTTLTSRAQSLAVVRASIALKSTRLGQLLGAAYQSAGLGSGPQEWRGMRMFLEQQVPADSPDMTRLYGNFRSNLRDIVDVIQRSGVPVLISTVGVNLKDCAPFASVHRAGLSASDLEAWDRHVREAGLLEQSGRHAEALVQYLAAAAIDDRYAELAFRIGRVHWTLGNFAAAKASFGNARELDALRFRADDRLNAIVREVADAAGQGVELIDGERIFADNSPNGIAGRELFHEHVHMTPRGNYLLAQALFSRVSSYLPAPARGTALVTAPSQQETDRLLALTSFDRRRVAKLVLEWLSQPPFTHQLNHQEQVTELLREAAQWREEPAQTEGAYRWAIDRAPEDRWLHLNHGLFLKDRDPAAAAEAFARALDLLPGDPEAREQLADALIAAGRLDDAIVQCREIIARRSYHAPAYLTMAYALAQKQSFDAAIAAYERAIELHPSYAVAALNQIGVIQLHQGQFRNAASNFRKAIGLNADEPISKELGNNLKFALSRIGDDPAEH